jgi:hypothetical protein
MICSSIISINYTSSGRSSFNSRDELAGKFLCMCRLGIGVRGLDRTSFNKADTQIPVKEYILAEKVTL